MMKKILVAALLAASSCAAFGQSAIVRGEASAGVYENIKSSSQSLNVTQSGTPVGITVSDSAVSVLVTATVILAANPARKYLSIQNQDAANTIFIRCDGVAPTADNNSYKLTLGQTYAPVVAPVGACNAIATVGTVLTHVESGQ